MKAEFVQAAGRSRPPGPGDSLQGTPVVRSRELFCVWADGLDGTVATQPAHAAQQGEQGVFMGLTANDSHLWNMCRAAEWGWRRQDIREAWVLQPSCMRGLSWAAAGVVLVQASGGILGTPGCRPFSGNRDGFAREAVGQTDCMRPVVNMFAVLGIKANIVHSPHARHCGMRAPGRFFFFHLILRQAYEIGTGFWFVCLIFTVQRKERAPRDEVFRPRPQSWERNPGPTPGPGPAGVESSS